MPRCRLPAHTSFQQRLRGSDSTNNFQEIIISRDNYCRLTVPPMVWIGFQGISDNGSMLLNIADIEHNPHEVDKKNIEQIEFNWSN